MSSDTKPSAPKWKKILKKRLKKAVRWIRKSEWRLLAFSAILLCSAIGFEAGMLYGREYREGPLIVEQPREDCPAPIPVPETAPRPNIAGAAAPSEATQGNAEACLFVGSKNSDKYHSPGCHWAKQIKPENIRCFASAQEAQAAGYEEGCIK